MNITYQSTKFKPENIVAVYVRFYTNEAKFFDVDAKGKTIREWWRPITEDDADLRARWEEEGRMQTLVSGTPYHRRKRA